eukprot:jgi/Psemu1/20843/gm1.20843_g
MARPSTRVQANKDILYGKEGKQEEQQQLPPPLSQQFLGTRGAIALLQGKCDSNVIKLLARWHSGMMKHGLSASTVHPNLPEPCRSHVQ